MVYSATEFDVRRELEELRQWVQALQPPGRLRLYTQQSAPFLGQPIELTVSAIDLAGQPLADAPLTVFTTWGNLRTTHDLIPQQASSLITRTNARGQVILRLLPPTFEDLMDLQQEALETFLSFLDPRAESPQLVQASLEELVQLYGWEANVAYRQAIDIYFRDFGQGLLESVNACDYLQSWSYLNATVVVFLHSNDSIQEGTTVTATQTISFKNWLAPWLETYLLVSQRANPLGQSFGIIKERGTASFVAEGVYDRLQSFINLQPGIVGQYIGRKVAETSVHDFLNQGMADLALEDRVGLAPLLHVASKTLQTSGVAGLASIAQARTELTQAVTASVAESTAAIAGLTTQVGAIATQFNGVQTQVGQLQTSLSGLDGRVATLNTSLTDTNGRLGTLSTRVEGLNTTVTETNTRVGSFTGRLDGLSGSITDANTRLGTLITRFDGLSTSVTDVNTRLGTLTTRFNGLNTSVTDVTTRLSTLTTRFDGLNIGVTDLNTRVGTFTTRLDGLNSTVTDTNTRLGTVTTRLDGLNTSVTNANTRLGTLTTRLDGLQQTTTALDGRLGGLTTQVTGLQTTVGRLDTQVTGLQTNVGRLDTQVTGLQTNMGRLDTQVTGLQTNVGRLDTQVTGLQTNVGRITEQVGGFQNRFTAIDSQVGGLQTRMGNLDSRVGGLQGNFDRFSRLSGNRFLQLEDSVTRVGNNMLSLRTDFNTGSSREA